MDKLNLDELPDYLVDFMADLDTTIAAGNVEAQEGFEEFADLIAQRVAAKLPLKQALAATVKAWRDEYRSRPGHAWDEPTADEFLAWLLRD